ncbi:MAG: long-chain fatty acid--CoA ligase [Candidatus Omnitrophica bacterium]|nr:long-chain fatty acid--CoA ligase [Candidatus Omnitrophota bacterium]
MKNNINNLNQLLDNAVSKFANRPALIFGARKITYQQLKVSADNLATSLYRLGIRSKDKVAVWLPNCPEFVFSFFAITRLGAVVVPINTMFKREEARYLVSDSQAKILICSIDKVEDVENILSRVDTLMNIISLPAPSQSRLMLSFHSLVRNSKGNFKRCEVVENDLAEIVYTSGTTGKPKGACLSHKNLISNIKDCSQVIKFSKADSVVCILPLFHSFASTVCMLLPIYNGGLVVIMRSVRPFKRVIRTIFRHRITIFVGVPSLYSILSAMKLTKLRWVLNVFINPIRLCISGAAALPLKVAKDFEKNFKRPLLQGYGLTEASPVVSLNLLDRKLKPGSVGRVLPSVKVKIVGKDGLEVVLGEVGELLVKGPNVMSGYYNLIEDTKKALKEGWLYTGDLAKMDEAGCIYIIGRSKEMINVRGFNVYPREIEDLLYQYPKIKEAAVVGVSHRHRGEVPVAFVVTEGKIEQREIINYLRSNLAAYKIPLKVFFKENLPKNATGKILKRELGDEVRATFEGIKE